MQMSPNVETSVQTQLAIPLPNGVLGKGSSIISRRHVGCRRVFVQTDNGSVLGLELDRADSVQTVKKKMQSMLNMPTEQSALVFGDLVLKNDLSELRNYAPLLLTRGLQRSLSTPCFSPLPETHMHVDKSQPLEVVGGLRCSSKLKCLIEEMAKAMECGVEPIPVSGGLGGAYYFRNVSGENIAIVKPTDEEPFAPNNPKGLIGKMLGQPGLKRAVRIGETGIREVAAYLLDYEHFAGVPSTALIKARHRVFHVNTATSPVEGISRMLPVAKIASCQEFVPHNFDASDLGASRFSVSAVHRIGILDVRVFNTDRHGGNILVRTVPASNKQGQWGHCTMQLNEAIELIPIDHGLCLPEAFEDPYFEWLHWPQASLPFSDDELDYISRLDVARDVEMLRVELPMLREACLRMLALSTITLKRAATAGLCLAEIGEMMSRDSCGMGEVSELELLCLCAKLEVDQELSATMSDDNESISELYASEELLDEQCQFHMDQGEELSVSNDVGVANRLQLKETKEGLPCSDMCQVPTGNGTVSFLYPLASVAAPSVNGRRPCISMNNIPISIRLNQPLFPGMHSTSPRNAGRVCGNLAMLHKISLVEEGEHSPEMGFRGAQVNSGTVKGTSSRAQSLKNISFNYCRQRFPDHLLFRKIFRKKGIPVSEVSENAYAIVASNRLSLGDMTEEEWTLFMGFFEEFLEEALVNWQSKKISHRQRLGVSCQF